MKRLLVYTSFFFTLTLSAFAASPRSERTAPDFTLPTTSGTTSLHDLRGKVVIVDFWASWCMPCRASFPWMSSMLDKYGPQGLAIVAVNLDKSRDLADAFLDRYPAPFTVAFDPSGRTAADFHVNAMPSSFIVDRTGKIVFTHEGFEPAKAGTFEDHIKEALSR